jgi:dienelactone hydrolase
MIGKIVSHYKLIEKIGQGGMGEVYLAEDTKLERRVALKFLPAQYSADEEEKKRFIHEAKAASALDHPNICSVHEIGETPEGQLFIVMGYYEGKTLKEKIKAGPLPLNEAVALAMQIVEGLQEAHRKGIIHRDLKPANIMLTEQGLAKIVDFGLAKLKGMSRLTKTGTTLGTVAYMSPEQALGKEVDQRSDIWSLGVILYEMLTGKLPFAGEYDQAVLYAVINEEPESIAKLRSDIPDDLRRIVRQALAKKPENRYQSADELLKELKKFHRSIVAPETVVFSFRRFFFRAKILVPALLSLCLLAPAMVFYLKHQAKVRWARDVALPEIGRLIEANDMWRDLVPVYRLAEKAEAFIPHDPKLAELFAKCSVKINIRTEPAGAKIFMKEYKAPANEWTFLGVSPIEKIRLPIGNFRLKMEKEGYETVLAASSTWNIDFTNPDMVIPFDIVRVLNKNGAIPQGMTRVMGAETPVGKLDDFYIDKNEVTNRQFKDFINKGGYRNQKYWLQKFITDGKELTWDEAVKLFVDQTGQPGPAGWQAGDYPEGQADYPLQGISWYEAAAYAEFAGKSLPTAYHWGVAQGEYTPMIQSAAFGGGGLLIYQFSNFLGKGPVPVGSLMGITSYGAMDMAGNVREWCWNEAPIGRVIRGGAWGDATYMFCSLTQSPAMDRSAKNGVRCALYPDREIIPDSAFQTIKILGLPLLGEMADITKETPVTDPIFQVFKEQFSYDKTDLRARVDARKETPEWSQERISFDAAYGGERVIAWLFLPKNAAPPYQAVIYMGADASVFETSQNINNFWEFPMFVSFLVKNGRAVLFPVVKGFFERGNDALTSIIESDRASRQWTEVLIQQVKDLKRSIDYLETRPDIDNRKLAYEGMSHGGSIAPVCLAVEERFKVSVLLAGGFRIWGMGRPEVNAINYVSRVKIPTLMLNGKYDWVFPFETSQKPMFDRLGTPAEHKKFLLYETDHIPPVNGMIRETLAWLDKYLGPVKR